jgi:hypothetical protein
LNELVVFNQDLVAELREECAETDLPLEDVAFDRLCETLGAEGEIETSDRCAYKGAASGKSLRIDGHGGDPRETEGILSVIVCEVFDDEQPPTLNAADAKKHFGHLINFVAAARRREFRDQLHIESPEFGVATMIAESWSSVTKVKLILVTNAIYSARTDAVVAGSISDVPVTYV